MAQHLFIQTGAGVSRFLPIRLTPQSTPGVLQGSFGFAFGAGSPSSLRGSFGFAFGAASPVSSTVQILPTRVTAAQAKAAGNTAQWQAFKARLDGQLNAVVPGAFEGGNMEWCADYALGYQCLNGTASQATANAYADKTVALLYSAANDLVRSSNTQRQFLARGDGVTTAFTLPSTPTGGFKVYRPSVSTVAVVRGATAHGQDNTGRTDSYVIKISNTNDGTADYAPGADWQQSGNFYDGVIDWSLASGNEPAAGSTYYVTYANPSGSNLTTGFTQSGTTLTMGSAPTTAQALFVEYLYTDGAGNAYRQTGIGFGGKNAAFIDSGYPARGEVFAAMAYDWIYNYAGFPSALKTALEAIFSGWSQWHKNGTSTPAQSYTSPPGSYHPGGIDGLASNYETPYYALWAAVGVALNGRASDSSGALTQATTYQSTYVQRDWRDAASTNTWDGYLGGWIAEGVEYARWTMSMALMASEILLDAGQIANATKEHAWAGEVIRCAAHTRIAANVWYAGGDVGAYPPTPPELRYVKVPAAVASDATAQAEAYYYLANPPTPANDANDCLDLIFKDPNATQTNPASVEPRYLYASGNGLVVSRAAWDYASTWVSFECGNLPVAGHNTFSHGTMTVFRGADDLLVIATEMAGSESFSLKILHGNLVVVNGSQHSAWKKPNFTKVLVFEGSDGVYAYAQGDYRWTFSTNNVTTPASECTRAILHVLPDYVFAYDRVATTDAATTKQLQWYFNKSATLTRSADAWVVARGSSKLFGTTYSASAITSANDTQSINAKTVPRVTVNPTSSQTSIRYATALQSAPSATASQDATAFVTSGDGKFEGALMGQVLALFGNTSTGSGASGYQQTSPFSYSYTAPGGTLTHYIVDLVPNQVYTLSGSGSGTATASANGVLTFTTTGSGSQTVTVT